MIFENNIADICVIFQNKQYTNIFVPSIVDVKRTSSDRRMYPRL